MTAVHHEAWDGFRQSRRRSGSTAAGPRRLGLLLCASALLLATALPARGDEPWSYTIGRERSNQQANFCTERVSALQVAGVFRKRGPRPGYEALAAAQACRRMVLTYTPREILTRVTISAGNPDEYVLSIVRVESSGGRELYLVTTRGVK